MRGIGRSYQGRGAQGGDKPGSGPGGNCVCPSCGHTSAHSRLSPCNTRKCPSCGTTMTRQ